MTSAPKTTTAPKPAVKTTPAVVKAEAAAPASPAPEAPKAEPVATDTSTPIPKVIKVSEAATMDADLKKKELIDAVVARSGAKKKDAKPVVEAVLSILGECLADGRELNLQPLGKLRINRTEDHTGYRIIVCKLRQQILAAEAVKADQDPLADAAE